MPGFLRAVHALHREAAFREQSDAAQLEQIFGRMPDTPASRIGRYCSLNLRKLTTYGTFEFRRFHGTLDAALATRWAHFCVAFVECFRAHCLGARLLVAHDACRLQLPRLAVCEASERAHRRRRLYRVRRVQHPSANENPRLSPTRAEIVPRSRRDRAAR